MSWMNTTVKFTLCVRQNILGKKKKKKKKRYPGEIQHMRQCESNQTCLFCIESASCNLLDWDSPLHQHVCDIANTKHINTSTRPQTPIVRAADLSQASLQSYPLSYIPHSKVTPLV